MRCSRTDARPVIEAIGELAIELDRVKHTLSNSFSLQLGQKLELDGLPPQFDLEHFVYLQYVYFTAVLSIHSVLGYPWVRALIGVHSPDAYRDDIDRSAGIVADTAREAILMTKYINLKAHTSVP